MATRVQFKTDIVKRYKNGEKPYQIADDEGCDYTTVLRELKRRGVDTSGRYWTKNEEEKLKKFYPINSNKELLKEFPNRTEEAIRAIASKLKVRKIECKRICKACGKEFPIKRWGNRKYKTICRLCAIKKWGQWHPENRRKSRRKWEQKNPEYKKEYQEHMKEYIKKYMNNYLKQRREEDPKFRLDQNMRNLIYHSLKGKKAGRRWEALVDYTLRDLMEHLESQFDENMTWENYGNYWHVDHVCPRSLFRYTFPEDPEFKKCWALENLQPLEKIANFRKSNIFIS
ncbi:MAG: hypothetical protein LiPW31_312 [Microgenomates group bacterium LiPW_31]|nr:MAG: hypothetical protein LiPW31_312 [Microgenomates group bacterium LiPW_31]